jgi:hypothetical protein
MGWRFATMIEPLAKVDQSQPLNSTLQALDHENLPGLVGLFPASRMDPG